MHDYLVDHAQKHEDDRQLKIVFETLSNELLNIEHCLNF